MQDLGTDVGNNSIQISANVAMKVAQAVGNIIQKIIEFGIDYNSPENKLARLRYDDAVFKKDKEDFLNSLDYSAGFVNHAKLEKYGVPLVNLGIENGKLSTDEFMEFSKICKNEGVVFSGVMMSDESTKKPYYILECRESDLEKMKVCLNKLNDNMILKKMDKKLAEYEKKGLNNLSQNERLERATLLAERTFIVNSNRNLFNDVQAQSVVMGAVSIEPEKRESFERALNRITNNYINKDEEFVVADMADPSKHIVCRASMVNYMDADGKPVEHRGRNEYIKTNYEVYNGNEHIMSVNDEWFPGKSVNDWNAVRDSMENQGGFSGGEVLMFRSASEYNKFLKSMSVDHNFEHDNAVKDYSDCSKFINNLESHLKDNGYRADYVVNKRNDYPQKTNIVDVKNGERLVFDPKAPTSLQQLDKAEIFVVAETLTVYKKMEWLSKEKNIAEAEMKAFGRDSQEGLDAKDRYDAAVESLTSLEYELESCNVERIRLHSAKEEFSLRDDEEHGTIESDRASSSVQVYGEFDDKNMGMSNIDKMLNDAQSQLGMNTVETTVKSATELTK